MRNKQPRAHKVGPSRVSGDGGGGGVFVLGSIFLFI